MTTETRVVADRLGVDPDHLRYFVDAHHSVTADAVLGMAEVERDDDVEALVAEWLRGQRDETSVVAGGGDQ